MADIDKTLSELGTSVKIEGPDQEVEVQKQEEHMHWNPQTQEHMHGSARF